MFDELLGKVNQDGLVEHEIVPDKDTFINVTFCSHIPEGNRGLLSKPLYKNFAPKNKA